MTLAAITWLCFEKASCCENRKGYPMRSYAEIQAQISALQAEAETARKAELANVIDEIKAKMAAHHITVEDLGKSQKAKRVSKAKSNSPAKYKGPNGELWAGGLGRKPQWVHDLLAAGQNLEDYRI
jgi:DNA-binding protein H-NS